MRCFCCNKPDPSFYDGKENRYYCTMCKDEINITMYNKFGIDDLYRIFKIDDVQGELNSLLGVKEKYKE